MDIFIFFQLIIVSVAATSAMTLFSYAASASFRELYKEPVLLTFMLTRLNVELPAKSKATLAWLLHYFIGFLFVVVYHVVWIKNILPVSFLVGFIFGFLSGVIGILGWMFMFKMSDHQPAIDFKGYYFQLLLAHIIFGLVATAVYSLSSSVLILVKAYVTV
ncbi:hypothetical protein ACHRV1_20735 [Flavobacterium aquidurense]|jgi:hypothetical protein|uniref:hypothetical protein n=1 Tax=Flavobacterium aquidurense TaxID=362413 RepID=UPI000920BA40|nr:hypothetical protein [Flavobacterium aquidurense]OXA70838.1 hypothetical protein B0A67_14550 [Flavobacterium aquidurense]SHF98191.1 hypothetical protein SAMN05444481_101341 [Flavobacterium frigidimaris]